MRFRFRATLESQWSVVVGRFLFLLPILDSFHEMKPFAFSGFGKRKSRPTPGTA